MLSCLKAPKFREGEAGALYLAPDFRGFLLGNIDPTSLESTLIVKRKHKRKLKACATEDDPQVRNSHITSVEKAVKEDGDRLNFKLSPGKMK
jgi:hypothetical protein